MEYPNCEEFLVKMTLIVAGILPLILTSAQAQVLFVSNFSDNTIHEFGPTGTDLGTFASTGLNGPVWLASSVPEPSALACSALMGAGALALVRWVRRRKYSRRLK